MTDVDERYLTAIHEAGHAIVAQTLGLTVEEVTVRAEDMGGGACYVYLQSRDTLDAIRRELSFVLAGRLATALARNEDRQRISLLRTIEVEGQSLGVRYGTYVQAVAALLSDGRITAAYDWLDRELPAAAGKAVNILREHWLDVQSLAVRLQAEVTVDLAGERSSEDLDRRVERVRARRVARARARARLLAQAAKNRSRAKQARVASTKRLRPRAAAIRDAVHSGQVGLKYASGREVR